MLIINLKTAKALGLTIPLPADTIAFVLTPASAKRSQQPARLPTIGFLGACTPSSQGQWFAALVQRLRELGWIEGQTVGIEGRSAEERLDRTAVSAPVVIRRIEMRRSPR